MAVNKMDELVDILEYAKKRKELPMMRKQGFTLIELVMILLVLVILSVVGVPRYINIQKGVQEASALDFMCRLNSALAAHISEHYVQGTEWVKNGEELMGLIEDGRAMPEGMTFENDTWTVYGAGMRWKFEAAEDPSPPSIVRIDLDVEKKTR